MIDPDECPKLFLVSLPTLRCLTPTDPCLPPAPASQFAKWDDGTKAASVVHGDSIVLFYDDVMYTINGTELVACADKDAFKEWLTNLETGTSSYGIAFDVSFVVEGDVVPEDFMMTAPTMDECHTVYRTNYDAYASSDERRTRRLTEDEPAARTHARSNMEQYAQLINEALDNGDHDGHHRRLASEKSGWAVASYTYCDYSDNNLCVTYPASCTFVFRGSDDAADWISNARGAFSATTINGRTLHGGFVHEFNKAISFINSKSCSNYKFIGHSLGGAIAEVARVYYGKGEVTTYGAPQLFDHDRTKYDSGERYFHEEDPVAGNLFGLNAGYWHQSGAKEIYTHSYSCGKGCTKSSVRVRNVGHTKNSGWWDTNIGAHSMANQYHVNEGK